MPPIRKKNPVHSGYSISNKRAIHASFVDRDTVNWFKFADQFADSLCASKDMVASVFQSVIRTSDKGISSGAIMVDESGQNVVVLDDYGFHFIGEVEFLQNYLVGSILKKLAFDPISAKPVIELNFSIDGELAELTSPLEDMRVVSFYDKIQKDSDKNRDAMVSYTFDTPLDSQELNALRHACPVSSQVFPMSEGFLFCSSYYKGLMFVTSPRIIYVGDMAVFNKNPLIRIKEQDNTGFLEFSTNRDIVKSRTCTSMVLPCN